MDRDAVTITIEGKKWAYFSEFELTQGVDSYSAAGFRAPFDYQRKEVRETFLPFSSKRCEVRIGGDLVFTGRIMDVIPSADPTESTVDVTAYSFPNDLNATPPANALPLEFRNLNILQIAKQLAELFSVEVVIEGAEPGAPFAKVHCEKDKEVQSFLVDLAKQRMLVLSDNARGWLVLQQGKNPGKPIVRFEGQPAVTVTPTFSPESYYSEITGFSSKKSGKSATSHTEKNRKYLAPNLRPLTFTLDDTESADVPVAVRAKLGRMMGNMVSYTIGDLPTWRDPEGYLWRPNETIRLKAPEAMVYRDTELLIRTITLRHDGVRKTASLSVCLPGAFSGKEPEFMPWDG